MRGRWFIERFIGEVYWRGLLGRFLGGVYWRGLLGRLIGEIYWRGVMLSGPLDFARKAFPLVLLH